MLGLLKLYFVVSHAFHLPRYQDIASRILSFSAQSRSSLSLAIAVLASIFLQV